MNDIKFITLDNGLTVLIYSDKTKITNHVELTTFFGGETTYYIDNKKVEHKVKPGTAHLLEHYICENNINGNLLENLYSNKSLNANATTYNTKTKMYFDTVYNLNENLELFLNSIYNVSFTLDKLDKTKYAVYNEIRDNKDNKRRKIFDAKLKGLFNNVVDTLGTKTSIKSIGYKYLEEVYRNNYVPKNQLLVVAGSFDSEEILKQIESFYRSYIFENNRRTPVIYDTDKVVKRSVSIKGDNLDEIIISYKIKTKDMSSYDKYKLDWYIKYFSEINLSRYSKLNEELKKDNIITGDLTCGVYYKDGYTILEVLVYSNKKIELVNRVNNTVNNFQNSCEELEMQKKDSILHISVRKDYISNYVMPAIDNYIDFDYPHNDTIDFVKSLNYDEYLDTIRNIDFSNYSILTVKTSNKK